MLFNERRGTYEKRCADFTVGAIAVMAAGCAKDDAGKT